MSGLIELDSRSNAGIDVVLWWSASDNETVIGLTDSKSKLQEMFKVPNECAADAFWHPFCYLPERVAS